MRTSLYLTTIIHERFNEFKNRFKYFMLSFVIDYDELNILSKSIKFFSYNKFNLYSYYEKDHGYRDGRSLRVYIKDNLEKNNIKFKKLKIKIICFPRILGYVFNPLSIIYCFNDKNLIGIFYEVKNTSNEQHTYFFGSNKENQDLNYNHKCKKNFYVSPFIGMNAYYEFKNLLPGKKISIIVNLFDQKHKKILTASQFGDKVTFSSYILVKQLIFNPFLTIKIIFAILYEAIFIVLKGGKYYRRKKKISDTISFEGEF